MYFSIGVKVHCFPSKICSTSIFRIFDRLYCSAEPVFSIRCDAHAQSVQIFCESAVQFVYNCNRKKMATATKNKTIC